MVIQLLGGDLASHMKTTRKFSLKTVVQLADQLLQILENIHNRSVIHRDIKPENIIMGRDNEVQKAYMVDFGISKEFRDEQGNHIPVSFQVIRLV